MAVVTLTTEWRADDYYFGIVRGTLERLVPGISVITNSWGLPPFNIAQAAFIIRNTFPHYPEGSVHLIFVHTEAGGKSRPLLVKAHGHFFVGTDNGIFSLALNSEPEMVNLLSDRENRGDLYLFAQTAADIISGRDPAEIGESVDNIREMVPLRATIDSNAVNGSVIFIDSYGNACTNITREIFSRVFGKNDFVIYIQHSKHRIGKLSNNYNDVAVGELLARFNNLDLLEIAINGANIGELYSLGPGSVIRVTTDGDMKGSTGLFT